MFCTKCGTQIDDDAVFCPKCGFKVSEGVDSGNKPIIKSKKECIYDGMRAYITKSPMPGYSLTQFGELENYEEGEDGKVYCEIVAYSRNAFGQNKALRFGAVIKLVEADGNCVFATPGPQLMNALTKAPILKRVLGFKSKR